eukprot:scaffold2619_cov150-Skeletonema_menzelii.AAC.5
MGYDCEEGEENPTIAGALFLPLQSSTPLYSLSLPLSISSRLAYIPTILKTVPRYRFCEGLRTCRA